MKRLAVCLIVFLTATSFKTVDKRELGPEPDILKSISEARSLLRDEQVKIITGVVGTKRTRIGRRKYREVPVQGIVGREMSIAIMDRAGDIRIVRAIKRDRGLEVLTPGFDLHVRRDNGINSNMLSLNPPGKILAVKYPVSNERARFGPGAPVIQAVYTPYSPEIATPEVVARGIEVQSELIANAYRRLEQQRIMSHAFPGRMVANVIPKDVVTVLLMNEHIDPGHFKSAANTKLLVEQVLTVIATNPENAYAYSISSAGARGLVQMIASTYFRLAKKYPEARLNPSFAVGMSDPLNAIVAQVLLCDADWQTIRTRKDIPAERIGPYLAAAYNGGVGRVLSILKHDQTDWMDSPDADRRPSVRVTRRVPVKVRKRGKTRTHYVLKSYTQPIFRTETSTYVRQYHWIASFFSSSELLGSRPQADQ